MLNALSFTLCGIIPKTKMPSAPKAQMFMKNNKIHWKMTDVGWTFWFLWSHVYVEVEQSHTALTAF